MATTKNAMSNLLISDFYKLSKQKSTYITLIISFAMVLVTYAIMWIAPEMLANLVEDVAQDSEAAILLETSLKEQVFGFSSLGNVNLFVAIISGIFIGKEFSKGMVRTTIARGQDRVKFYFSKWISIVTTALAFAIVSLVVSLIFNAISGFGSMSSAQSVTLVRCIGLQFLAIISVTSIYVMLGFVTRSSGSAIGTAIGLDLLLGIVLSLILIIPTESGNSDWVNFMPFQQMTLATTSQDLNTTQLIASILMPIVYTAISCLIGCLSFVKRDIK